MDNHPKCEMNVLLRQLLSEITQRNPDKKYRFKKKYFDICNVDQ